MEQQRGPLQRCTTHGVTVAVAEAPGTCEVCSPGPVMDALSGTATWTSDMVCRGSMPKERIQRLARFAQNCVSVGGVNALSWDLPANCALLPSLTLKT